MSYTLKVKRVTREAQMKAEASTNGESSNNSSDKGAKQVNSLLLLIYLTCNLYCGDYLSLSFCLKLISEDRFLEFCNVLTIHVL